MLGMEHLQPVRDRTVHLCPSEAMGGYFVTPDEHLAIAAWGPATSELHAIVHGGNPT